jgi:hypothetical protein
LKQSGITPPPPTRDKKVNAVIFDQEQAASDCTVMYVHD